MIKFKGVEGGTPTGEPLCRTCNNCIRVQGKALSQTRIFCKALNDFNNVEITFEAFECSKYDDQRLPRLYDMEKEAWILRSDARTKKVGFVSPAQKKEHQELLND
jgi:hypothetical protein